MRVSLADALCILEGSQQPEGLIIYALNGSLEVKIENFIISVDFEYGPLYATLGECDLKKRSSLTTKGGRRNQKSH